MALNVAQLCAKSCTLFMWSTSPMIPDALEVMAAWGFAFKTVAFCWIKQNKNNSDIFIGLGHYTRGNAEFVLCGTRGPRMERKDKGISSVIISPRQEHSQKPIEAAQRIRRLYGAVPSLELFARSRSPYFETMGDELDGVDIREILK